MISLNKTRENARLSSRRRNTLFDEKITRAQWDFLKRLAVADRQCLNADGHQFRMCVALQKKGLVAICLALPSRTRRGFASGLVTITNSGSRLVLRQMSQTPTEETPS
jgi:hypothetical protein